MTKPNLTFNIVTFKHQQEKQRLSISVQQNAPKICIRQQSLSVTIEYPEMEVEILPYFEGNEIPVFEEDNLWFL